MEVHINLVIRRERVSAARYLKKSFNTPCILRRPYGIQGIVEWLLKIAEISGLTVNQAFLKEERQIARSGLAPVMPSFRQIVRSHLHEAVLSLGGHSDVVGGILSFGCRERSLSKGTCWCDCPHMGSENVPYFTEEEWVRAVQAHKKGYLMVSSWAGYNTELQISNPDIKWRLHPYEPTLCWFSWCCSSGKSVD